RIASKFASLAEAGSCSAPAPDGPPPPIDARRNTIATRRPSEISRRRRTACRMTTLTEGAILDALRNVQEPELGRAIVTLQMVKSIAIEGSQVAFTIELTTPACPLKDEN